MEFLKKPEQSSYPGGMSDNVVEKFYNLIKDKPNDLTNNMKLLNNVKKILKKVSANAPSTNLAFSSIVVRKGKRNIEKSMADTNARLENLYAKRYWIY